MGYSAGSTDELLWWETWRDPLASYSRILSGILGGMRRRAALVGYSAGSHWRAALAGSTGEPLWRDTHWRAALAGHWAGSTGQLLWWDTRRDPLTSYSGGILGGMYWRATLGYSLGYLARSTVIHWQAALAGYSAGLTGEQLWRDTGRDPLASCFG